MSKYFEDWDRENVASLCLLQGVKVKKTIFGNNEEIYKYFLFKPFDCVIG